MRPVRQYLNRAVTAFALAAALAGPAAAEETRLDQLFDQLGEAGLPNWRIVEQDIWLEWSKSGSPAMDLLLKRGREAMEAGDLRLAIAHFTALTDHAPDFAEGFNARATAHFRAGRHGPAMADIARTLALNPRHFGALTGLGRILEESGRLEQAAAAYRAAHAIHPNDPDIKGAMERLELQTSGMTL